MSVQACKSNKSTLYLRFAANVANTLVRYQCDHCGEEGITYVIRQLPQKVARTCLTNINNKYAATCKAQAAKLKTDNYRKYTNYDMCYEYTSEWELQFIPWIPKWWENQKISHNTDKSKLIQINQKLNEYKEKFRKIELCKREYFVQKCGITDVNVQLLQCMNKQISYYQHIIKYLCKLNKCALFYDFQCAQWGICHGCGSKIYIKTQYEKSYVHPYSRKYMHQVELLSNEAQFVCQWCIIQCDKRAREKYNIYKNQKNIIYAEDWSNYGEKNKFIFAAGHLNNERLPLHLAWFDISTNCWNYNKLIGISNMDTVVVTLDCGNKLTVKLQLKTMHSSSYFIYQSPSTSWSLKFKNGGPNKFWLEEETLINTTLGKNVIDITKLYKPDSELIDWNCFIAVVRGKSNYDARCLHLIHMKILYHFLSENNLLEKPKQNNNDEKDDIKTDEKN